MRAAAAAPVHRDALGAFIHDIAGVAAADPQAIEALCDRLGIPRDPAAWRSTLNNDGAPIQICLGLRPGAPRPNARIIADVYRAGDTQPPRIDQSQEALARLADWHAPPMAELAGALLARMTPSGRGGDYVREGGDSWLAAGIDGRGIAVYATARWGDPVSRWRRALAWLYEISPAAGASSPMFDRLADCATLLSAGIEGSDAGDARVKFYWRPNGSAPLAGMGIPLFDGEALAAFLADATDGLGATTPAAAIVGSVGVSIARGSIADVKFDLCGHCVRRSRTDWARRIGLYADRHGMTPPPLARLAPDAPVEIAFVGLGIDHRSRPRLNIYLKPIVPAGAHADAAAETAMET